MSGSRAMQRRLAESFVSGARRSPPGLRRFATRGPGRNLLAAQIMRGMAREFDRERGREVEAVVRWEVGGEGEQARAWDLVIREGRCRAVPARRSGEQPRTTISLDHETLLALAVGELNPPQAYISGRLKLAGDVGLAQRLIALFRVPATAKRPIR